MPPSTRPSTFNATSSPDPHREYSEPELPHIRKVLSQRHEPDRPRLGMPYPPASFEFGRFIPDKASVEKAAAPRHEFCQALVRRQADKVASGLVPPAKRDHCGDGAGHHSALGAACRQVPGVPGWPLCRSRAANLRSKLHVRGELLERGLVQRGKSVVSLAAVHDLFSTLTGSSEPGVAGRLHRFTECAIGGGCEF